METLPAWIRSNMDAMGWTVDELARRLREAGYEAEPQTVYTWIAPNKPRRPRPATLQAMQRMFRSIAPVAVPRGQDASALARIEAKVDDLRALIEGLRSGLVDADAGLVDDPASTSRDSAQH